MLLKIGFLVIKFSCLQNFSVRARVFSWVAAMLGTWCSLLSVVCTSVVLRLALCVLGRIVICLTPFMVLLTSSCV